MKVLVINCGSSSLKYRLIETDTEAVVCKGLCERIGVEGGHFRYEPTDGIKYDKDVYIPDHDEAVHIIIKHIIDPKYGVIKDVHEIDAVGHRIVHGGDKFGHSAFITPEVMKDIEQCNPLAPIHNPVNIQGIRSCMKYMPDTAMVGVFDTAFHHSLPEEAYLYGIPYEYYRKYKIRRYGFHGMSHQYVSIETAKIMGKPVDDCKVIVCHLGNGASICAVENGRSIDTSMGYTPLEGIIMGTRCGSIDPEIINIIAEREHKKLKEVMSILNNKSGVYGLSDYLSADMRDLEEEFRAGNQDARRALETYAYAIVKYIGAYMAVMNGADAISFTAGIGEHSALVRKLVCSRLQYMGVVLDEAANESAEGSTLISAPESRTKVYVIPTDEELSIARQTVNLLKEREDDAELSAGIK